MRPEHVGLHRNPGVVLEAARSLEDTAPDCPIGGRGMDVFPLVDALVAGDRADNPLLDNGPVAVLRGQAEQRAGGRRPARGGEGLQHLYGVPVLRVAPAGVRLDVQFAQEISVADRAVAEAALVDALGPVPGLDRACCPDLGEGGEAGFLQDGGELGRAQRVGEVGGGVWGVDERLRARDRRGLEAPALAAAVEAEAGADSAVWALQAAVGVEVPDGLVHRVGQAVGAGVEGGVEHLGALGQAEMDVARGRRQPLVAEVEQPVIGQAVVIGTVVPVAGIHRAAVPALGPHDREPYFGIGALLRRDRMPDGRPFA